MSTRFASEISLDILSIILLAFLAYLISRNTVLTKRKTKRFIFIIVLTMIVIVAEIGSVFLGTLDENFRIANIMFNVIGFSISPIIPIEIAFLYEDVLEKKKKYILIPLFINIILTAVSAKTGWIFEILESNYYKRGPLFFTYVLCSIYAFVIFIYASYKYASQCAKSDKRYLYGIYMIVLIGNIIQIVFPGILVIWGCVSISLTLYYIFLRELQFKYDPLTKMLNRQAFERKMEELMEAEEAIVVVFDLNNLKNINDTYGHQVGDTYIIQASAIICESFEEVGKCYRIGGDEFCVLGRNIDEDKVKNSIQTMIWQVKEMENNWNMLFQISYGYSFYGKKSMQNVYDAFIHADKEMYQYKKLSKKKTEKIFE